MPEPSGRLTIRLYPPYFPLDWESPRSLARSVVKNAAIDAFKRNGVTLGHATVELSCGGRVLATGMTKADLLEAPRLLLEEGLGLGLLFHDFAGKLEEPSRVAARLRARAAAGRASSMSWELSGETGRKLLAYADEYARNGSAAHYGLPHRPLRGEGAGCSAFAVSFLEAAGLLDAEMRAAWTRTLHVPEKLIGGPGRRVSLSALLMRRSRWAEEGETHRSVTFYDPGAMHVWAMSRAAGAAAESVPG